MILILAPDTDRESPQYHEMLDHLSRLPGVTARVHQVQGREQTLTEIYLLGNTAALDESEMVALPCVERVVRVSADYRILGRHKDDNRAAHFAYNGVDFSQDNLHVFAGLCAVDTPEHVDQTMRAVAEAGLSCTRMGAYKPRTNPYAFQGHGKSCLPWVFESAGRHGIKVIAMEVTHDGHLEEIHDALEAAGRPTGVMLQIGTRNTQNFELLKHVGRQTDFPVLLKRGFGITLEESLNAAEYLASEGNSRVIFCLRGMKTHLGDPHRNFVDFTHIPVVKRLTRMPVCIDPSHSVGSRVASPDGIMDMMHATAQGVVAGANMILLDVHPAPQKALVDGPQALRLEELPWFLEDVRLAREAYERRRDLAQRFLAEQNRQ
ncbi:3-deoxy-7-phosphoheptulonate synthase [Alkalilimnicola ehrlichii]|uniref:3-deoxy-7-phosphoheptulonate synthase n=1 Tax=Alkalilimnicola ehrlichii TaxID=351052 RepID=UPI003BA26EA0